MHILRGTVRSQIPANVHAAWCTFAKRGRYRATVRRIQAVALSWSIQNTSVTVTEGLCRMAGQTRLVSWLCTFFCRPCMALRCGSKTTVWFELNVSVGMIQTHDCRARSPKNSPRSSVRISVSTPPSSEDERVTFTCKLHRNHPYEYSMLTVDWPGASECLA